MQILIPVFTLTQVPQSQSSPLCISLSASSLPPAIAPVRVPLLPVLILLNPILLCPLMLHLQLCQHFLLYLLPLLLLLPVFLGHCFCVRILYRHSSSGTPMQNSTLFKRLFELCVKGDGLTFQECRRHVLLV